ncbi:hypothetical protein BD626DRAFT_572599 [Schizophyllum amplum]|uniref:Uncharacterized protein n=1 Tax=Schizophyllum amplum TaxID=97359 RepID=A0A550C4E5_9AGAR|nr:hypothetical protein BD626DRAFT_572599 [Auriculariopsis ampla]
MPRPPFIISPTWPASSQTHIHSAYTPRTLTFALRTLAFAPRSIAELAYSYRIKYGASTDLPELAVNYIRAFTTPDILTDVLSTVWAAVILTNDISTALVAVKD